MTTPDFTTDDLKALFAAWAARMAAERDALCALDGLIGDGDHGIAMAQGMQAASVAARAATGGLQDHFTASAQAFLNAVGASSGPLYATALLRAGKAAGNGASMPRARLVDLVVAMRDGIAYRGKAVVGQKTMLDAWTPAAEAALAGAAPADILAAAQAGRDATVGMLSTLGRSARLGERSRGHVDPGAASAVMLIKEIVAAMG